MLRTRTVVNIPVALVWQQKTASIVALIARQSRPGRKSLADVGIRNVLAKLSEVENAGWAQRERLKFPPMDVRRTNCCLEGFEL
jgi:hypothetical protein